MKIIIAYSPSALGDEGHRAADLMASMLEQGGHKIERMAQPDFNEIRGGLSSAASYRLIDLSSQADAIICLSASSTVVRHPRKIAWPFDGPAPGHGRHSRSTLDRRREEFMQNIIVGGLRECETIFAPSRFALRRLASLGFRNAELLGPPQPAAETVFERNGGPELLCLAPLTARNRPELVIRALKYLPETIRLRWLAPVADDEMRSSALARAEQDNTGHRLTIDVRKVEDGELDYLLSQCLAYVSPGRAAWVVPQALHRAVEVGAPVIICRDAGAAIEALPESLSDTLIEGKPKAIANSILDLTHRGELAAARAYRRPATNLTPLVEAVGE